LSGLLVYDLDESETTDTFDAPANGVDYTIPFGMIHSIEVLAGAPVVHVLLWTGGQVNLQRQGDAGDSNAGALVFVDGQENPEYVPWQEIRRIALEHPRALFPRERGLGGSPATDLVLPEVSVGASRTADMSSELRDAVLELLAARERRLDLRQRRPETLPMLLGDPSRPYAAGDVPQRELPERRLIMAGEDGRRAFVAYEHGGIGTHAHLLLFRASGAGFEFERNVVVHLPRRLLRGPQDLFEYVRSNEPTLAYWKDL
jgi:hypothetical protein